jgi:tetratricopeptide (TPR) repeat protein
MWGWLKGDQRQSEEKAVTPVTRNDAEYLRLLQDLLERLEIEPGYASVLDWFVQRDVKEEELTVWLRGSEGKISEDLRHKLGWLTGLGQGELTIIAEEIWRAESLITFKLELNNSEDPEEWFNQGDALNNLGRYEEAIKSYNQAISFKHDYYEAWFKKSGALENLGKYEEAIES